MRAQLTWPSTPANYLRYHAGRIIMPAARHTSAAVAVAERPGGGELTGSPFVFTNSALWMLVVLGCILLFMWGGPAQQDTWDPKPDAPAEFRGEFQTIPTSLSDCTA